MAKVYSFSYGGDAARVNVIKGRYELGIQTGGEFITIYEVPTKAELIRLIEELEKDLSGIRYEAGREYGNFKDVEEA